MLAILFLLGSALLGIGVVRRALRNFLDNVEQLLWGVITGWILTSLGVYLAARWQENLGSRLVLWSTIAIWIVVAILAVTEYRREESSRRTFSLETQYTGLAIVLIL